VAGNGLVEGLAIGKAAEVEALAPAILVQVGREVVVVAGEGGVLVAASLGHVSKRKGYCGCRGRTLRVSSVSSAAALLSQCLKYSSTAACWAALSFLIMAAMPPVALDDWPCMALLKSASREWFSCSSATGDIVAGLAEESLETWTRRISVWFGGKKDNCL
jgi:hypothetical protein